MAGTSVKVKQEYIEEPNGAKKLNDSDIPVVDLETSDEENDDSSSSSFSGNGKRSRVRNGEDEVESNKRKKKPVNGVVLPEGFLDPLPPKEISSALRHEKNEKTNMETKAKGDDRCKQFWKAGDFEGISSGDWNSNSGGMDHLRVHPRFLHSNATSHKWVLGAFAELLDNSLDEVCNGATYVKVDMLKNKKDENRMLLIEDNGGGMDPDKMRLCMSLGFSLKSKLKDTIGQYGNGFKTSTMRLGADVIVFSRCSGKNGKRSTQSIGLLSYTFLRSTGKEDIIVPMLDYKKGEKDWEKIKRSSGSDWDRNLETIVRWSPFSSEVDLLRQFDHLKDQGTRIIIYNLWEDDQGQLELDFDTDKHDIQIRGVNRDEKNIEMAELYPNSKHYLTYRHSLRSYASILYLRVPSNFRMILRGKDVPHHNIVNDMMMKNEITYRPQSGQDVVQKDSNMVAVVTVGFVKDAKAHIDVQGFNVYHKNRLIKPFWRIWNASGSDGRGVIGILEANFVEPAHDKQGFERTTVLQRLESRLIQMQKTYWHNNCHKIGYAPRRGRDRTGRNRSIREKGTSVNTSSSESSSPLTENILDDNSQTATKTRHRNDSSQKVSSPHKTRSVTALEVRHREPEQSRSQIAKAMQTENFLDDNSQTATKTRDRNDSSQKVSSPHKTRSVAALEFRHREPEQSRPQIAKAMQTENIFDDNSQTAMKTRHSNDSSQKVPSPHKTRSVAALEFRHREPEQSQSQISKAMQVITHSPFLAVNENETFPSNHSTRDLHPLVVENRELKEKVRKREEELLRDLLKDLETQKNRHQELEAQLAEENQKFEVLNKEQDSIIAIFSEERERRALEEETLRKKLKEADVTKNNLMEKVTQLQLEKMKTMGNKWGQ